MVHYQANCALCAVCGKGGMHTLSRRFCNQFIKLVCDIHRRKLFSFAQSINAARRFIHHTISIDLVRGAFGGYILLWTSHCRWQEEIIV